MAFGNNAYDMLQAEQQARAAQLAALGQNPNMRRAGVIAKNIGGVGRGAVNALDEMTGVSDIVNHVNPMGSGFLNSIGQAGRTAGQQIAPFVGNMGRDVMNRIDADAGLNTPQRQMVSVPSRQQILSQSPAMSPQPDALSGPAFAPASLAAMPQGAMAAEAQQRATPATRSRNTAASPAMPPTPQERQANLAQSMASPETLQAVAEAGSVPGGKSEPIKKRGGFSPENMGMIAFGLTLMTGGDMNEALNNGLTVHGNLDGMRDEKEQKAASQELLKNVPKEYVPAMNALIASKQFDKVADYSLSIQEEQAATEAANAQRAGLVSQAAGVLGVSPEAISMMPADKLSQMMVNRFDNQGTMQINAQKAQIEASKQAAMQGDEGEARAYLAQFGVDAEMLSGKALEKEVTKFATGDFSSSQAETAGHAYIMATVLPRLDYLEENFWQGDRMGFGTNVTAANEYRQLLEDLTLAINRKDSGAAVAKDEFAKTERLYGFQSDKFFGANKASNAQSQENRRTKLKAFAAQTGGAYQHMIVTNPIAYGDDLTAAGVEIGADFFPTAYSANPLGIELEGVE